MKPSRVIDRDKVGMGMWYARCCLHDLYRINNAQDLEDAKDEEPPYRGVWLTLHDALTELLPDEDDESIKLWLAYRRGEYQDEQEEIEATIASIRGLQKT